MAATIQITGNLSQDPELREVGDNGEVLCRLNVGYSIDRGRNDNNFIEVTTWGEAATAHAKHLAKGSKVRIDGELDYQTWEADDGTKRSKHRIIGAKVEYL